MFRGCVGLNTAIDSKDTFTCVDTFPLLREEADERKRSRLLFNGELSMLYLLFSLGVLKLLLTFLLDRFPVKFRRLCSPSLAEAKKSLTSPHKTNFLAKIPQQLFLDGEVSVKRSFGQ